MTDTYNLNELAEEITYAEGLKHPVNIGDVKEILKLLFKSYSLEQIVRIWLKYNKNNV